MKKFLCWFLSFLISFGVWPGNLSFAAGTVDHVVVSQAGYSANDFKIAYAIASDELADTSFQVLAGSTIVMIGTMEDEGITWGKRVYSIDFSSVTGTSTNYTIKTNGKTSYPFQITTNNWAQYQKDMITYYRVQRSHVATEDSMVGGYQNTKLSQKAYHLAGHLDDAWSPEKQKHYDLTGGWYDAGDFGIYSENQWVAGEIALVYLRHQSGAPESIVDFDFDGNGIPDLLDEAYVGSLYGLKVVDAFGGLAYNVRNRIKDGGMGGWTFPYALNANGEFDPAKSVTDNIIAENPFANNVDDRIAEKPSVEGSAKIAGMLAAVSRAFYQADKDYRYTPVNLDINDGIRNSYGEVIAGQTARPDESYRQAAKERAIIAYDYAYANQDGPKSNYFARGGVVNPLLWAEVELYLLTNDEMYYSRAKDRIMSLTFNDLSNTNYWDLRPISMIELYPKADARNDTELKSKIKDLLKSRVDYFMDSANDTPYGVLNEFSDFGVNEPHMSYVGDIIRYYEVFKKEDPAYAAEVLRAAKKGVYWVFGNNPWNISWVSGVGTNHIRHLHSRFDLDAYNTQGLAGVVIPGAMVCGPNLKNPGNAGSQNPWYEDLGLYMDGASQWRYNEHSISIQVGLLYSIMALSAIDANPSGEVFKPQTTFLTPKTGDKVTGAVYVAAQAGYGIRNVEMAIGNENRDFTPMSVSGDVYSATIDVTHDAPYSSKRIVLRSTLADGSYSYTTEHMVKGADLPDASQRQLYDNMSGQGVFGSKGSANWVMWYANNGPYSSSTYSKDKETIDGREVRTFTYKNAPADNTEAQFRPEGDLPDWTGYKYLYLTAKNTGDAALKFIIEVKPGKRSAPITVPAGGSWQEYRFDLDELFNGTNHKTNEFYIWLIPGAGNTGKLSIDTIEVGNEAGAGDPPVLKDSGVDKRTGDESTTFHFRTTYVSPTNMAPFAVQAVIDGIITDMKEEDTTDTNYVDGKSYVLSKELPRGEHTYYFRASDLAYALQTDREAGPSVVTSRGTANMPKAPGHLKITGKSGSDVTLSWAASRGGIVPMKYEIYDRDNKLGEVNGLVTTYTTSNLAGGIPYQFHVRAVLGAHTTDPSNVIAYMAPVGNLPGDFQLISPANVTNSVETNPTLSWSASSNAANYTLVVSKYADYSKPFFNQNVGNLTGYALKGLALSTTYYWKVIANNSFGAKEAMNNGSSFTIRSPQAPMATRLDAQFALMEVSERKNDCPNPAVPSTCLPNGWGKRLSSGHDIPWLVHFPTGGTYDFTIRVWDNETSLKDFSIRIDGVDVPANRFQMSAGDKEWKDISGSFANVTAGTHAVSVRYHTSTSGVNLWFAYVDVFGAAPSKFSLAGPANNATGVLTSPTLNWEQTLQPIASGQGTATTPSPNPNKNYKPFGATDYTLIVSENSNLTSPVFNQSVGNTTSYTLKGLKSSTKYYWKVIASNVNGSTNSGIETPLPPLTAGSRQLATSIPTLPSAGVFSFTTAAVSAAELVANAISAIDALPPTEGITLQDSNIVEDARRFVESAIAAGASDLDIVNLPTLADAEEKIASLLALTKINAIAAAIDAITALPESVTLADKAVVGEARALVNAAIAKGAIESDITNLAKLTDHQTRIASLEAAKIIAISTAIHAISVLPAPSGIALGDKNAVAEARALVNAAVAAGATVGDITNLAKLSQCEVQLHSLEAAKASVILTSLQAIDALPSPENLKLANKNAVNYARVLVFAAMEAGATDEDITNLDKLAQCEAKIPLLEGIKADALAAANLAIAALPEAADVTLESRNAVEAARMLVHAAKAAGALNSEFSNLPKLIYCEVKLDVLIGGVTVAIQAANRAIADLTEAANITLTEKDAVEEARMLVNAAISLGADEGSFEGLQRLLDCELAIGSLEAAIVRAIQEANRAIADLPDASSLTLANVDAVKTARSLVNAAIAAGAAPENLGDLQKLAACELAISAMEASRTASIASAIDAIAALPQVSNLKLADKGAVEAARGLVNAAILAGATEADLTNLRKLEDSEAKIIELLKQTDSTPEDPSPADIPTNPKPVVPTKPDQPHSSFHGDLRDIVAKGNRIELEIPKANFQISPKAMKLAVSSGEDAQLDMFLSVLQAEDVKRYTEGIVNRNRADSKMTPVGAVIHFSAKVIDGSSTIPIAGFSDKISAKITLDDKDLTAVDVRKLSVYRYDEPTRTWAFIGGKFNPETKQFVFESAETGIYSVMEYQTTFTDIRNHWAQDTIEVLASQHIVNGTNEAVFAPESIVTRAEFTALLTRALGLEDTDYQQSFDDVSSSKWYANVIQTAFTAGLITGSGGTFRPDDSITREEMMVLIMRAYHYNTEHPSTAASLEHFSDKGQISPWAFESFAAAKHLGIISGMTETELAPKSDATRAQAAVLVSRLLEQL
jgi:hypothetical protein